MKYSNSNKPLVCMMTQSTCYKGTTTMTPRGVLWHSTGANNPQLKRYVQPDDDAINREEILALLGKNQYKNDWNHITYQAGLNAWIGKLADGTVASVQTMPWDYRPWGCGSGSKGSCNNGWMQFEICEDGLNDKSYFNAVYQEACELTAYYCQMYNLDPYGTVTVNGVKVPVILDHKTSCDLGFGSNHGDVQHWFKEHGKTLEDVRKDVAALMGKKENKVDTTFEESREEKPKPNSSKVDTSAVDSKVMWEFFKSKGLNDYGIAGLMGNLYAESGLKPTNLQNTYETKLGMTDAEYTAAVDSGSYTNFVNDSAGYGLAQWTYWSLKQEMLNYHKAAKKSIGDGKTQMEFLVHQLTNSYKAVWSTLQNAKSVREASDAVLLKFERPADQSAKAQEKRAELGMKYYNQYHIEKTEPSKPEKSEVKFKAGDLVLLAKDAVYYSGKAIPSWVKDQAWYVKEDQNKDRVIISKSENGKHDINSPVNEKYLILKDSKNEDFVPYPVKVTASVLNYRQGPGTNYKINGTVKKNEIFTIIDEENGWGKLQSGAGWISLNYTKKF